MTLSNATHRFSARSGEEDYDAVVVGARVAGAATAMLLARRGMRVLLVDRRRPDTDTLSTHAMMRGGVLQLHRWGLLDRVRASGAPPIRRTTIHYGDTEETIDIRPKAGVDALYAPRRYVLDSILVRAAAEAGATVRFGVSVSELLRDERGRVVGIAGRSRSSERFEARAPITVGADGLRSTVARETGAGVTKRGSGASGVIYNYCSGDFLDGYEWFYRPGATAGIIPTNHEQACVWVGVSGRRFLRELRWDLERGFHRLLAEVAPEALQRINGETFEGPFRGFPGIPGFLRQPWGPGWALVGDASHFKDPLSTHGMTDALRDAELLARAIEAGLGGASPEAEALEAYRETRDRLSLDLFTTVDAIATYRWTLEEVRGLLIEMAVAMGPEVEELTRLDQSPIVAVSAA